MSRARRGLILVAVGVAVVALAATGCRRDSGILVERYASPGGRYEARVYIEDRRSTSYWSVELCRPGGEELTVVLDMENVPEVNGSGLPVVRWLEPNVLEVTAAGGRVVRFQNEWRTEAGDSVEIRLRHPSVERVPDAPARRGGS